MRKAALFLAMVILLTGCTKKVTERIIGPSPNIQTFEFNPQPNDFVHLQKYLISAELKIDGLKATDLIDVYFDDGMNWQALPYVLAGQSISFARNGDSLFFQVSLIELKEIINIPTWYKVRVDVYFVD